MKHTILEKRDPHRMLRDALIEGWFSVENIPVRGEGAFLVMTLSGLIRRARSTKRDRIARPADQYGPMRTTVIGVETGNYLAAIAWRPEL
ncbi:hypothetical protein [uncultured Litoreibacter sp.]|uniref:hypothetical protein n=1 Tax=uncultured Litoreibacter sp. TaxID=1392394 RepID=UPI0026133EF6|nr:hypothetical protein [uncultured Litoreibacter sp.]